MTFEHQSAFMTARHEDKRVLLLERYDYRNVRDRDKSTVQDEAVIRPQYSDCHKIRDREKNDKSTTSNHAQQPKFTLVLKLMTCRSIVLKYIAHVSMYCSHHRHLKSMALQNAFDSLAQKN
jgi:hypothetical protein